MPASISLVLLGCLKCLCVIDLTFIIGIFQKTLFFVKIFQFCRVQDFFFFLDIFFIYISNAILKVPYNLPCPAPLPTHSLFLGLVFPCTGAYKVYKTKGPYPIVSEFGGRLQDGCPCGVVSGWSILSSQLQTLPL